MKGGEVLKNDMLERYRDKECLIEFSGDEVDCQGKITQVQGDWIELVNDQGKKLVNTYHMLHIRIL